MEEKIDTNKMFYKGYRNTYGFKKDKTIHAFGDDIKNGVITMDKENEEKNKLSQKFTKPTNPNMVNEKSEVMNK